MQFNFLQTRYKKKPTGTLPLSYSKQAFDRLKVKAWKKIVHTNGNQKKAGVAILISDKIDFKVKIGIFLVVQ